MTGRIIPFRDDPHAEVQTLLPWFITDRLEAAERSRVEAHLSQCAACQEQERLERGLAGAISAMPVEADQAWSRLRLQLAPQPPVQSRPLDRAAVAWGRRALGSVRASGLTWVGWAAAASLLVAVLVAAPRPPTPPPAIYHTLGAPPMRSAGNLVVIFRPDAREADMRAALRDTRARLVDGPTAADAYVLRVAPADRAGAVAALRRRAAVVLAEPVDSDNPP